jgi:IPT/TIG domain
MSRRSLLALLAIPVFFLAAAPAFAKKHHKKKVHSPVVRSIHPLKLKIGEKLTIHGKYFRKGRHKDTIVFLGAGKRVVWVKADRASSRTITLKLPSKLAVLLAEKGGKQKATRLRVRIIARKSGRSFTARRKSPIVSLAATIVSGTPQAEACPGASNPQADSDADGLSNALEGQLKLDPCNADTDGDGVADGFEYQSALDLNRNAGTSAVPWPYPGKRPYPNPLDASDAGTDYDGDGMTLAEEYAGSKYLGFPQSMAYSDGDQTTGAAQTCGVNVPSTYCVYADTNLDGVLQDDEKDADGDGLPNWDEAQGRETQAWWAAAYLGERPYPISYPDLNWLNPDSDGDGINDANDDTDHDGYTNLQEIDRDYATSIFQTLGAYMQSGPNAGTNTGITLASTPGHDASVNPDNPCLPDWQSAACMKHPPFTNAPAPFDGSVDVTWPSGPVS